MTLIRIFESTIGRGTGVSRPVSSTMFLTVTERQATAFSTSKTSSCFDFSFTDVASAGGEQKPRVTDVPRSGAAVSPHWSAGRGRDGRRGGVRARAAGARVRLGGHGPAGQRPWREPQGEARAGAAVGAISRCGERSAGVVAGRRRRGGLAGMAREAPWRPAFPPPHQSRSGGRQRHTAPS